MTRPEPLKGDVKTGDRLLFITAAIEALPVHSISGYEWECANCEYDWDRGTDVDSLGNPCDHMTLIDRDAVIRLLTARYVYRPVVGVE
jgi:hypothetical protein